MRFPVTGWRFKVTMPVPLLNGKQVERLPSRAREVVEYRKSRLSPNHIQDCPLARLARLRLAASNRCLRTTEST
jgi:hypothetical protein